GMGSAGGHTDMGGAQLPIGILGEGTGDDESLESVVTEVVTARLFEELDVRDAPSRFGIPDADERFEDSNSTRRPEPGYRDW
ncbi:MAG: hypothetical protein ABEJ65_07740, partial [bacterium]